MPEIVILPWPSENFVANLTSNDIFFRFSSMSENLFSRCLNIRGSEPQDIGTAKIIGQFVLLLSHSVNAFRPLSHFRRYFVNTVTTLRQSHVTMLRRKHPFVDVLSHDTVITGRG